MPEASRTAGAAERSAPTTDLGRVPFAAVWPRMHEVAAAIHDRTAPCGEILLVEHDPVYTAGRASRDEVLADDVVRIERGGRVTYHGPGQLVVYPIVPLPRRDVRAWLRSLEALGVAVCESFDLEAKASVDGTGVFVARTDGSWSKVVSIGVAIKRWVNLHGIAINFDMDLAAFHRIRPCGLDPDVVGDLSRAAGRRIGRAEVVAAVEAALPVLGLGAESAR